MFLVFFLFKIIFLFWYFNFVRFSYSLSFNFSFGKNLVSQKSHTKKHTKIFYRFSFFFAFFEEKIFFLYFKSSQLNSLGVYAPRCVYKIRLVYGKILHSSLTFTSLSVAEQQQANAKSKRAENERNRKYVLYAESDENFEVQY